MFKSILLLLLFPAGYKKYHVMHSHKKIDPTTVAYMYLVAEEDDDPKDIEVFNCKKNKDSLKDIGAIVERKNSEHRMNYRFLFS